MEIQIINQRFERAEMSFLVIFATFYRGPVKVVQLG